MRQLVQGILPPLCLLCGAAGAAELDLCTACAHDLARNSTACPRCAQPLPGVQPRLCGGCQRRPPPFDRAFVPLLYQPPVDALIKGLKFGGRLSHARVLGALFAKARADVGPPWPDAIVPVPLHRRRLRERGFNQALELARTVAHRQRLPLWPTVLQRVRDTPPQSQRDARQRQTNPLGAFTACTALTGQRVALFDDVVSTASTARECARVLRTAGAVSIELWAIARASGD